MKFVDKMEPLKCTYLFTPGVVRGRFCDKIVRAIMQNIHRIELYPACRRQVGVEQA